MHTGVLPAVLTMGRMRTPLCPSVLSTTLRPVRETETPGLVGLAGLVSTQACPSARCREARKGAETNPVWPLPAGVYIIYLEFRSNTQGSGKSKSITSKLLFGVTFHSAICESSLNGTSLCLALRRVLKTPLETVSAELLRTLTSGPFLRLGLLGASADAG